MPRKKGKGKAAPKQAPSTSTGASGIGPATTAEQSDLAGQSGTKVTYESYKNETQMPAIMGLIDKDLSEPYSIFTYRYFIHNWPHLCLLSRVEEKYVGVIVCKADEHKQRLRGYVAMLAVDQNYRNLGIGSSLAKRAIDEMIKCGCDEIVLETEVTNKGALRLYENLGFARDARLCKYYLNGVDAFRLKLWLK